MCFLPWFEGRFSLDTECMIVPVGKGIKTLCTSQRLVGPSLFSFLSLVTAQRLRMRPDLTQVTGSADEEKALLLWAELTCAASSRHPH